MAILKICVISWGQYRSWQRSGVKPDCKEGTHRHYKVNKAFEEVHKGNASFLDENAKVIIDHDATWNYVWKGAISDHTRVMQMLPLRRF